MATSYTINRLKDEIERLRAENEALKRRIAGGVRVQSRLIQRSGIGMYEAVSSIYPDLTNATLLLDEKGE